MLLVTWQQAETHTHSAMTVPRLTTKVKKWAEAQFLKVPIPSPKQLGYPSHSLAYEMTHSYKNWQPRSLVLPSSSEMAHAPSVECVCVCARSVMHSVVSDSLQPRGLQPTRPFWAWNFPGKNTAADSHFLLQGIFPTQRLDPHLLHWQEGSLARAPGKPVEYISLKSIHFLLSLCLAVNSFCNEI